VLNWHWTRQPRFDTTYTTPDELLYLSSLFVGERSSNTSQRKGYPGTAVRKCSTFESSRGIFLTAICSVILIEFQEYERAQEMEVNLRDQEIENIKHQYEESMREHYSALSQQYSLLQSGLQEEIRRILQEKNTVIQNAREERLQLDSSLSSLSAKYVTLKKNEKKMS
jgi:hypothetical protein